MRTERRRYPSDADDVHSAGSSVGLPLAIGATSLGRLGLGGAGSSTTGVGFGFLVSWGHRTSQIRYISVLILLLNKPCGRRRLRRDDLRVPVDAGGEDGRVALGIVVDGEEGVVGVVSACWLAVVPSDLASHRGPITPTCAATGFPVLIKIRHKTLDAFPRPQTLVNLSLTVFSGIPGTPTPISFFYFLLFAFCSLLAAFAFLVRLGANKFSVNPETPWLSTTSPGAHNPASTPTYRSCRTFEFESNLKLVYAIRGDITRRIPPTLRSEPLQQHTPANTTLCNSKLAAAMRNL